MPSRRYVATGCVVVLLAAFSLTGCAGNRLALDTRVAPPATDPDLAVPDAGGDPLEIAINEAIESARESYDLGVEALRSDQRETAREYFDRAIEVLLDAPVPVVSDPRLSETYNDLVDSIYAMELDAGQSADEGDVDEGVVDELETAEPSLSPEGVEKELQLVEGAESTYDLPVVLNDKVLAWIETYSNRIPTKFEPGLVRSGKYLDMIRRIFREEGLPEDLAYMAHVESAYKVTAYSRAKAKGMWQFIAGTGRRYGLRRDWWIDERSDPEMATRAAAAYLRDLHEMFGDWYLAMAAYNAGEGKVQRAIRYTGSTDFWKLANTRHLRRETKNYVPAILATIVISKSPERFGFTTEKEQPVVYDTVKLDEPIDLRVAARCAGTTVEEIKALNPALTRLQTPPGYPGFELRLPQGTGEPFRIVAASLPKSERLIVQYHRIAKGDTLSAIARRYGVSMSAIASANGIRTSSILHVGQTLQVPTSLAPAGVSTKSSTRTASTSVKSGEKVVYKVRRGDTLYSIASRHGTTVSTLRALNGMGNSSLLMPGQRLTIAPGVTSAPSSANSSATEAGSSSSGGSGSVIKHRVRRGDTLSRIARAYGSTVDDLCRWNEISRDDTLRVGATLVLYR